YDCEPSRFGSGDKTNAMSDRIFVGPQLLRSRLVNNGDICTLQVIALGEYASADERCLQHAKIAGTHNNQRQVWRAARIERLAFDSYFGNDLVRGERERAGNPSLVHAGNAVEPVEQLAVKSVASIKVSVRIEFRMIRNRQPYARGFHIRRIKSGIDIYEAPQSSREQSGTREQHERHSNFSDNQAFAHAILAATAAASALASTQSTNTLRRQPFQRAPKSK